MLSMAISCGTFDINIREGLSLTPHCNAYHPPLDFFYFIYN